MKKVFSLLAVLALVCMASSVWAAFTDPIAKTAIATFTGGDITFNVSLYLWDGDYVNDTQKENLEWNNPSTVHIANATEEWANSTVYALIHSEITTTSGKVYIYTKNKSNSSPYVATYGKGNTGQKKYDGLVRANSNGAGENGQTISNYAPLKFVSVPLTYAKNNYDASHGQPDAKTVGYGDRYITDYDNFDKDLDYMTLATSQGIWEGTASSGTEPNVVTWDNYSKEDHVLFFGAGFTNVLGGDTFGTNTITFNTSVE